jgi:hypothetical protein
MVHGEPADGVVPVASAREPHSATEVEVPATHSAILRDPKTICEVKRILYEHLRAASLDGPDNTARACQRTAK